MAGKTTRRTRRKAPDMKKAELVRHREVTALGLVNEWFTIRDWTVIETTDKFIAFKDGANRHPKAQFHTNKVDNWKTDEQNLRMYLQVWEERIGPEVEAGRG